MGVVKVILNGVTKMDITPTTADANEVNQGEVFFNRSGEQSVGTSDHAKEQQIAYVESDSTASRAYAVGEYFCLNGLLHRVTAPISSGGTFTPGTNCTQVVGGGLNELMAGTAKVRNIASNSSTSFEMQTAMIVWVVRSSINVNALYVIDTTGAVMQLFGTTVGHTISVSNNIVTVANTTGAVISVARLGTMWAV